jgi:probable F420-dependent oxidoreductase
MKYGTSFPQDGLLADPVATRDFAQAVEGLGYDFLTGSDRVLDKNPRAVRREPFVLLGFLAACTERIELGTSVVITPQRQTVLVAKQIAEIDVLSGGRVHLGIGLGYQELEFQALNENIHNRGRRVEEQIEVLRALWTQPTVTFHGKYHQIEGLGIAMRPKQQPIPIWMGGTVEPALRRIARLADGWIPPFGPGVDIAKTIEDFRGYARDAGRDLTGFPIKGRLNITGSKPEDWLRGRDEWEKAGATHFAISLNDSGFTRLEEHIALLRAFREAIE